MRTIYWLIRTVLYLLGAKGDGRHARRLRDSGDLTTFRHLRDSRVRHWALAMLRYAGVTVEVHGEENILTEPALYLPNHQSDWDIPIMIAYGPSAGLLAKDSIGKIPLIQTWMGFMECVFIDRGDARKSLRSLREVDEKLKQGRSMVVFPEGTRSKGEEIGTFHNGSFRGAIRNGIPIVPVSIDGSYKIMEANSGKWIRPGHVILSFLPAIDTKALDKEQQKKLGDTIIEQIYEARERSRAAGQPAGEVEPAAEVPEPAGEAAPGAADAGVAPEPEPAAQDQAVADAGVAPEPEPATGVQLVAEVPEPTAQEPADSPLSVESADR